MSDIVIICEHEQGRMKKYSLELAYKASRLAHELGCKTHALIFGEVAQKNTHGLGFFGIDTVRLIRGDEGSLINTDWNVFHAAEIVRSIKPEYMFASSSVFGKELLPRIAACFNAGMASECVDAWLGEGAVIFRRPIYAGRILADVTVNSDIKFATFRPNIFEFKKCSEKYAEVFVCDAAQVKSKVKSLKIITQGDFSVNLSEAKIVVAGGRDCFGQKHYKDLKELADCLGGALGASRAAVDAGFVSHDIQVGQTGKIVNPILYIACGISGAAQHLAGMKTAKFIVAINKDPEAPIFLQSDLGIVGDVFDVIGEIVKRLKNL